MILLFQNMLINSFCIFLDTDDENKNESLEENHSNSLPESSNSKKNKPIKISSQVLSGSSRLEYILIFILRFYYLNMVYILYGHWLVYEDHENINNCQSKSQSHTIYNKRNNIIKSGHQVLSGIQLKIVSVLRF